MSADILVQDGLDLSLPISTLLHTGTSKTHEELEHSQGAGWLSRGELDKEEYIRFLMMLWHVYESLERGLDRHASHGTLQPTYNPILMARASSLSADIASLLQVSESSWQSHRIHKDLLLSPPSSLTKYTVRLQSLADSEDPSRLLAHAYVRYLGDLSGGQFIRRQVAKAYGLESDAGLAFYNFTKPGGTGWSTIGDMKKIKEWYREGMNAGVGDDRAQKVAILDEANIAFQFNAGLFNALRPPIRCTIVTNTPSAPPLGEPKTPVGSTSTDEEAGSHDKAANRPVRRSSISAYHLSSVIAFIAALSLSHLVLALGGFIGGRGTVKLEVLTSS